MTRSRRLSLFTFVLLILAASAYGAWRWHVPMPTAWFGSPSGQDRLIVSGNIEAHQSVLSFTQIQASIVELPFDEGAIVAHDTILARVDDKLYRQQIEIDRTNQQVAAAQVAVYEKM